MSAREARSWLDLHRWRVGVWAILVSIVVTVTFGNVVVTRIGSIPLSIPPYLALITPAGAGVGVAMLASYQVDLRSVPVGHRRARACHTTWLIVCTIIALAVCTLFGWYLESLPGQGSPHVATLTNGMLLTGLSLMISAAGVPGASWLPGAGLLALAIVAAPATTATAATFLSPAVSLDRLVYASLALGIGIVASIVSVGGALGPLKRLDITS